MRTHSEDNQKGEWRYGETFQWLLGYGISQKKGAKAATYQAYKMVVT